MIIRKRRYAVFRLPLRCGEMTYVGWVEAADGERAHDRAREQFGPPKLHPRCLYLVQPWNRFNKRKYGY